MRYLQIIWPPRVALGLMVAGGLLLNGCSLVPAYQQPAPTLPATLAGAAAPPVEGKPVNPPALTDMERTYLRTYGFQGLEPLLSQALAHNADFRLATLQVEQARAQYRIERASELPQLNASAQGARQQFDDKALQARYQQHVGAVGIGITDYELDFFGRVRALSEAARERYLATTEGQEAMRGAVLAETLRAYVQERVTAMAISQWQRMDADQMALADLADRQFELGVLSSDDRDALRHTADQTHAKTMLATDEYHSAVRSLQILVGYDASWEQLNPTEWVRRSDDEGAWRNLDSKVLLERPDVRQAEAELRAAHADIGAARAAFFPSIQLTTAVGTVSDGLSHLFDGSRAWQFMPQLNLPIFDYGRNRAGLALAEAKKNAAVATYQKTVELAFREAADALDARATSLDVERREQAQVERVRQRYARLNLRAQQGLEDRVTVLSSGIEAAQAELSYLQAVRDAITGRVGMFRAFYGISPHTPP